MKKRKLNDKAITSKLKPVLKKAISQKKKKS